MLAVYNVQDCPCRNSWPCVCNKNLRNVLSMQQTLYLFTFKWKVLLENQILFSVTLFTKAQCKAFKASTAEQNMKIFFMYNPTFSRSGQRYPSKVFCLLIYGKILIPQKTKFSVRCINFAANCLFHIAINAF